MYLKRRLLSCVIAVEDVAGIRCNNRKKLVSFCYRILISYELSKARTTGMGNKLLITLTRPDKLVTGEA
jgi:hypothetical protein